MAGSGVVRNALVYGNKSKASCAGVYVKGGRLEAPRSDAYVFFVTNAAYVVFDDLTVRGGDDA